MTIGNIEWFSVEEKNGPLGVKLLLATDEGLEFGFACGWPEKNEIYYSTFDRKLRKDVRYWAILPSYPGPAEEAKKFWLSGHKLFSTVEFPFGMIDVV
jgi:hypothetical protein